MRSLYLMGWAYLSVAVFALWRGPAKPMYLPVRPAEAVPAEVDGSTDGGSWFRRTKPFCNALEAETVMRRQPPPETLDGAGYGAACLALAGKIAEARARILTVAASDRWKAAGIVFDVGHPVADAGDDRSAGPIMDLVVEFWPNHYMALYHAGAARYAVGEFSAAKRHLTEFLKYYHESDGWTGSARGMLTQIDQR